MDTPWGLEPTENLLLAFIFHCKRQGAATCDPSQAAQQPLRTGMLPQLPQRQLPPGSRHPGPGHTLVHQAADTHRRIHTTRPADTQPGHTYTQPHTHNPVHTPPGRQTCTHTHLGVQTYILTCTQSSTHTHSTDAHTHRCALEVKSMAGALEGPAHSHTHIYTRW